mmetsp:Transcript_12052/g.38513  ORF Transcript_12052/g.38513 Transcript_12052/m.38513 type:complete len:277 (-) Transcript_12052:366-1196(-)
MKVRMSPTTLSDTSATLWVTSSARTISLQMAPCACAARAVRIFSSATSMALLKPTMTNARPIASALWPVISSASSGLKMADAAAATFSPASSWSSSGISSEGSLVCATDVDPTVVPAGRIADDMTGAGASCCSTSRSGPSRYVPVSSSLRHAFRLVSTCTRSCSTGPLEPLMSFRRSRSDSRVTSLLRRARHCRPPSTLTARSTVARRYHMSAMAVRAAAGRLDSRARSRGLVCVARQLAPPDSASAGSFTPSEGGRLDSTVSTKSTCIFRTRSRR